MSISEAGSARAVSAEQFDDLLAQSGTTLVLFGAPWCSICRALAPVLDAAATRSGSTMQIAKVSVDDDPDLAQRFGVQSVPAVLLFRESRLVRTAQPRTREDLTAVLAAGAGPLEDSKEVA